MDFKKFITKQNLKRAIIIIAAMIYFYFALSSLEINWMRVYQGLDRGRAMFADFFRPDFVSRWDEIYIGVLESLTMTYVASAVGALLSFPIAFGAAKNISPKPIYLICRAFITISRSFQDVIIALFFVVMIGFGPLAGVLTLLVASIGFIGKLLAEEIENIDQSQIEAIKSTGASWLQVMYYGVWTQIKPRFIGLSMYRLDINFRSSAIIGVVGAGGIGATLTTAFDLYQFNIASAILIVMIAIVLFGEISSGMIRKRVQ